MLQAPAGNNSGVTNGSASVPFNTTLVFAAGSTLKLQNASLYVQNQGSALQAQARPSNPVNFTSYNDATIGGATNNNPDTTPNAGDWGGIVFRNYDQAAHAHGRRSRSMAPLVGPNGGAAVSGASDAMSILNNFNIRYAGGAVPQGSSNFFSAHHALQLPADDHQRQHRRHRRHGRNRGGHRRRPGLVPRRRHGPRSSDPPGDRHRQ